MSEKKKKVSKEAAKACTEYEDSFKERNAQIKEILDGQTKIIEALSEITSFLGKLAKQTYEDKDGKKKDGPLWVLIKQSKRIGAF